VIISSDNKRLAVAAYVYPLVGRSGLGNCLFPWARAVVFAHKHELPILAPSWGGVRLGPYFRREPDKRRYGKLFQYDGYVRGLKRARALVKSDPISEYEAKEGIPAGHVSKGRDVLVVFEGLDDFFTPLLPYHVLIREKLWNMIRPGLRNLSLSPTGCFFAAHVRRGDQVLPHEPESKVARHTQCTPIGWFVKTVESIRQFKEYNHLPFLIFTDGAPSQVAPLLEQKNVMLAPRDVSIVDLLRLSRASLLLASGYSTFSMWASFLGGMPTIYAPGKLQQRVQAGRESAFELELSESEAVPLKAFSFLEDRSV
jgi:hypothetical protein